MMDCGPFDSARVHSVCAFFAGSAKPTDGNDETSSEEKEAEEKEAVSKTSIRESQEAADRDFDKLERKSQLDRSAEPPGKRLTKKEEEIKLFEVSFSVFSILLDKSLQNLLFGARIGEQFSVVSQTSRSTCCSVILCSRWSATKYSHTSATDVWKPC